MKLFLTSAGLTNKSLQDAFLSLLDKPVEVCKVILVITAANAEEGDKLWLV